MHVDSENAPNAVVYCLLVCCLFGFIYLSGLTALQNLSALLGTGVTFVLCYKRQFQNKARNQTGKG
jgi:hypothetical protein